MVKQIIKILLLVIVFLAIVVFFMYWLERLDIVKTNFVTNIISRALNRSPQTAQSGDNILSPNNDVFLLEKIRLDKQQETLVAQRTELDQENNSF